MDYEKKLRKVATRGGKCGFVIAVDGRERFRGIESHELYLQLSSFSMLFEHNKRSPMSRLVERLMLPAHLERLRKQRMVCIRQYNEDSGYLFTKSFTFAVSTMPKSSFLELLKTGTS